MQYDVIAIGGSYAGMAAVLQLIRARRSVLVIDAGQRRNRFASHSHGFLGQDGVDPTEIARAARRQLEAYPTLTWREGLAVSASGEQDGFVVTTEDVNLDGGRERALLDELNVKPGRYRLLAMLNLATPGAPFIVRQTVHVSTTCGRPCE